MIPTEAYPLTWPQGWPRTPEGKRGADNRFGSMAVQHGNTWRSRGRITPDVARKSLRQELGRLGARNVVISTNIPVRQDGEMHAGMADRKVADPGIAVYFSLKGKQMVMAQDAYVSIAGNMRSLALAIEAMRALERHGGGTMMERAFGGFAALPGPEGSKPKRPWYIVLNYGESDEARADLSVEEIEARYRTLAKRRHPDAEGGSTEAFQELTEARDEAVRYLTP